MNEFKGTPGPWLYRGKSDSVHAACETHPYGKQIFQFNSGFNEEGLPNDADLALVLAAPRLLAAAIRYLEFRHTDDIGMGCEYSGVHPETDLKNAIAEATSISN